MDPAAAGKPRLPIIRHSTDIKLAPREKRYVFDKAYDGNTDNRTLYNGTVKVGSPMHCPSANNSCSAGKSVVPACGA